MSTSAHLLLVSPLTNQRTDPGAWPRPSSAARRLSRGHGLISWPTVPLARHLMAAAETEELPPLCAENDAPSAETNQGDGQREETGPETDEQPCSVATKMEADEEKPATEADKATATAEAATDAGAAAEETVVPQEPESKPETRGSPAEGCDELAGDNAAKETKEESGEDSRSSGLDCEKSKSLGEDGEKPGGGGGGGGELGDKRRPSVEMSSSDGEPLSRMDSEDRSVGDRTASLVLAKNGLFPLSFTLSCCSASLTKP